VNEHGIFYYSDVKFKGESHKIGLLL